MKESRFNIWVEHAGAFYVYNGVSGALLRISREDYLALQDFLSNRDNVNCRPALLSDLVLGQMLVSDDSDELAFLSKRYQLSRFDTTHLGLTIVTSLGCNFDCPYCFESKHPSIIDDEVREAILQLLDDKLSSIGSFNVCWYGGEPLIGKHALLKLSDDFIERCDANQVQYSARIITNGYLLDEQTCEQLRDRRIGLAQITIDGPPEIHNRMRPLASGGGSFERILNNLRHAVNYLNIAIRINVDEENFHRAEELLQILAGEGFSGKLTVYVAQIVGANNLAAPAASYSRCHLTRPGFARVEQEFANVAARYGFTTTKLPTPTGAPCTAVRSNEFVIGSKGELYKCFESVGNQLEVIGDIRNYRESNGRLQKWLKYDPFSNDECRGCIALPVCMGGCAHHAFDAMQYENRCGTFRHTHKDQVLRLVIAAEQLGSARLIATNQLAQSLETR